MVVAEFHDGKLTGRGAAERFAEQSNRAISPHEMADGQFRFVDGFKTYKPIMTKSGWQIVVVDDGKGSVNNPARE